MLNSGEIILKPSINPKSTRSRKNGEYSEITNDDIKLIIDH